MMIVAREQRPFGERIVARDISNTLELERILSALKGSEAVLGRRYRSEADDYKPIDSVRPAEGHRHSQCYGHGK